MRLVTYNRKALNFLHKFIGVARWRKLKDALLRESPNASEPDVQWQGIVAALSLGIMPVLLTVLDSLTPETHSTLPTVGFGVCAALAIVLRWRLKLPFNLPSDWRASISLTHTAVALGCVPAVILIIISPELLAERHDLLTDAVQPSPAEDRPGLLATIGFIALIAAWVAVVEEVLYRSLIVSTFRRWKIFPKQYQRDLFAALVSASLFGLAHYATWGPVAALALVGLGLGFVMAYLATEEQIVPVIIYHFVFDFLSIGLSVVL